jgi:signal transduction histidine kinase
VLQRPGAVWKKERSRGKYRAKMLHTAVSHDLRNMLAIIIGNCELAARQPQLAHIVRIRSAAVRGAALLESDTDEERIDFAQPVDVNAIVREVIDTLRSALVLVDKVKLVMELTANAPMVAGSSLRLYSSVLNLCLNARDAMVGTGGTLTINSGLVGEPPSSVILWVCDTGKGMSAKKLSSLWVRPPPGNRPHGHGLQIVKDTVTRMAGEIDVQSKVGAGTSFRISLPARLI